MANKKTFVELVRTKLKFFFASCIYFSKLIIEISGRRDQTETKTKLSPVRETVVSNGHGDGVGCNLMGNFSRTLND